AQRSRQRRTGPPPPLGPPKPEQRDSRPPTAAPWPLRRATVPPPRTAGLQRKTPYGDGGRNPVGGDAADAGDAASLGGIAAAPPAIVGAVGSSSMIIVAGASPAGGFVATFAWRCGAAGSARARAFDLCRRAERWGPTAAW